MRSTPGPEARHSGLSVQSQLTSSIGSQKVAKISKVAKHSGRPSKTDGTQRARGNLGLAECRVASRFILRESLTRSLNATTVRGVLARTDDDREQCDLRRPVRTQNFSA